MSYNKIFSGLEHVGFKDSDLKDLSLYEKEKKSIDDKKKISSSSLLYERTIVCPVCETTFKQLALKSTSYRMISKDSDFFIRYAIVNPYFYDVYVCEHCGYSALKVDFNKISEKQKESVLSNISTKFKSRTYPKEYNLSIAIERYKLALLNATYINSKSSTKAMICLKLAWMYRLSEDSNSAELEKNFLKSALEGFNVTLEKESMPVYKMNTFLLMYLIGELNRRLEIYDTALSWFSRVITTPGVSTNLKELTRTQRDLIKETLEQQNVTKEESTEISTDDIDSNEDSTKSNKGFFSKLFGE